MAYCSNSVVISGSRDCTIRVWDIETGDAKQTLRGHLEAVNSVDITADGKIGVSGKFRVCSYMVNCLWFHG